MTNENIPQSKQGVKPSPNLNQITFNGFEDTLAVAGQPSNIGSDELSWPAIDDSLLDEQYRVGNSTPDVSPQITGNRPLVKDVAPPPKMVTGIEPEKKVIDTILAGSPLNHAELIKTEDETAVEVSRPPINQPKKSFWGNLFGR